MEKRAILAFVLMALVLVVSQYFLTPRRPPSGGERPEVGAPPSPAPTSPAGGVPPAATPTSPAGEIRPARPSGEAVSEPGFFSAPGGETVQVRTPLYLLEIDPFGGVVSGVSLLRYRSYVDSLPVELVPSGFAFLQRELLSGATRVPLDEVRFEPGRESLEVDVGTDSLVLTGTAAGMPLRQVYRFSADSYVVGYRLEAPGVSGAEAVLETHLGPRLRSSEKDARDEEGNFAAVARVDGEVHSAKPDDLDDESLRLDGVVSWAGLKTKYFLGALLADQRPFDAVTVAAAPADTMAGLDVAVRLPLEGGAAAYRIYLGPQAFQSLTAAAGSLEDVNQYGWSWIRWMIQPFAHLIVRILLWMHEYVPNYGVVLIIFGVLVRLLMWPLTQKSFESMQRMQALQPEMTRLRERYKNDPQRMQQEVMRLYRERGVNPLGGCLPNLLPLPVLFALFFVFQNTIEFRGAPFVLWIQDLSRPDPYYVLPILMGVTMFIQQKLTTTGAAADNPQMKMMLYFMPAFLTFIFLNLASGLVLYYIVSNVLTFVQQLLMRRGAPTPAPEPVPARK